MKLIILAALCLCALLPASPASAVTLPNVVPENCDWTWTVQWKWVVVGYYENGEPIRFLLAHYLPVCR